MKLLLEEIINEIHFVVNSSTWIEYASPLTVIRIDYIVVVLIVFVDVWIWIVGLWRTLWHLHKLHRITINQYKCYLCVVFTSIQFNSQNSTFFVRFFFRAWLFDPFFFSCTVYRETKNADKSQITIARNCCRWCRHCRRWTLNTYPIRVRAGRRQLTFTLFGCLVTTIAHWFLLLLGQWQKFLRKIRKHNLY